MVVPPQALVPAQSLAVLLRNSLVEEQRGDLSGNFSSRPPLPHLQRQQRAEVLEILLVYTWIYTQECKNWTTNLSNLGQA